MSSDDESPDRLDEYGFPDYDSAILEPPPRPFIAVREDDLTRFLSKGCAECGTPGPRRHLSAVAGCATCAADDPRPVNVPVRNVVGTVPSRAVRDAAAVAFPPFSLFLGMRPDGAPSRPRACCRLPGGAMVHVKPDCW